MLIHRLYRRLELRVPEPQRLVEGHRLVDRRLLVRGAAFQDGETLGDACGRSLHRIKFWCMPRIPLSGVRISCESEAMKSSFAEATRLSSS